MDTKTTGFTLIELIIVLVIISLLAYFSLRPTNDAPNVDAQAEKLAADIRYVQFLSMSRHNMLRLTFSSNGYSVTESDGITPIILPTASGNNSVSLETGISASSSANQLYFNYQGIPYNTITTALTSNITITLTATDGSSNTLTLIPETGHVTIS
jgi:prepilin-type N-terminal cleavage/methylation domain-containing protein